MNFTSIPNQETLQRVTRLSPVGAACVVTKTTCRSYGAFALDLTGDYKHDAPTVLSFDSRNHALAPIAQIRMRLARADGWPMAPATCTFFIRRFRHRNARFLRLVDRQITHYEEFFEFFLVDLLRDVGVRIQHDPRFQRVAN